MDQDRISQGFIRRLWPTDMHHLRDHLLRLDKESRRLRFAHGVSDAFVEDYAALVTDMDGIVYGYFDDSACRAVAELRKLDDTWMPNAEAAFSVEGPFQDRGVGTDLMGRVIRAARNRGVRRLYMSCLAENGRMRAIACKYDACLRFEYGEVIGEILPPGPSSLSLFAEAVENRVGFLLAVLDLQGRLVMAA
ncbi:MAG: GNAT family N-acetyltransferase [Hyphomicrobiaceae bacterium]